MHGSCRGRYWYMYIKELYISKVLYIESNVTCRAEVKTKEKKERRRRRKEKDATF